MSHHDDWFPTQKEVDDLWKLKGDELTAAGYGLPKLDIQPETVEEKESHKDPDFEKKTNTGKLVESSNQKNVTPSRLSFEKLNQIINSLPHILRDPVDSFESFSERLIMTYSTLTAAGSLLPTVYGEYRRRKTQCGLFTGILASPASNKGVIGYNRTLLSKVHKRYRFESEKAMQAYQAQLQQFTKASKSGSTIPLPQLPPYQVVVIAGDITGAKLIQQLRDNQGVPSIMIEDEIDVLINSANGKYGQQLSYILRKVWGNETVTQMLKGGNQHYEIERTFLGLLMAGTPDQMKKLIGSIENGLYSRFSVIKIDDGPEWQDIGPCETCPNREDLMEAYADQYLQLWEHFNQRNLKINLTPNQLSKINTWGKAELGIKYNLHHEMTSSLVKRHPNMAYRMCMILTAIRYWEKEGTETGAFCSDEDFDIAMQLMGHSYLCSIAFFNELEDGGKSKTAGKKEMFLQSLPDPFSRKEAVEIAKKRGIEVRTTGRYIDDLLTGGLISKIAHGRYQKIAIPKPEKPQDDEGIDW